MGGKAIKMFQDFYSAGLEKCWGYILRSAFGSGNPGIASAPLARQVFLIHFLYFLKTDFSFFKVSVFTFELLLFCLKVRDTGQSIRYMIEPMIGWSSES